MARDKHDKAHDLAEQAVDKAAEGDPEKARDLVDQAREMDPKAVDEVAREVEQDREQAERYRSRD